MEIRLRWPGHPGQRVWTTMRTPGHDFELATGWAFHEGWIGASAPSRVAYCTDADLRAEQEFNVVTVDLTSPPDRAPAPPPTALSAGSSACGVCGSDTIDALERTIAASRGEAYAGPDLDAEVVRSLPDRLRAEQPLFDRTGGTHAAALVDLAGGVQAVREDVGRHNAVDKVAGTRLLAGQGPNAAALVVSGRAGFELVQKAAVSGVGALVAVGAPTSLAVELARRCGLALWGFTSAERSVRYA
ncbi:formate dehydrogenase accessory sulfurtransferase FdhD [Nocardioides sp. Y6]|uniref:Formate dehydrogenase accessory sulfurtransferase FdhD n=2 Tax=Nocardioides malaquae TaxID=2773426 RepID=A0ABR9RVT5_9ACTN|nr:formate dehydrogenase accessory sulfurtransferase FdhD [Nocardioides malaquae]